MRSFIRQSIVPCMVQSMARGVCSTFVKGPRFVPSPSSGALRLRQEPAAASVRLFTSIPIVHELEPVESSLMDVSMEKGTLQ